MNYQNFDWNKVKSYDLDDSTCEMFCRYIIKTSVNNTKRLSFNMSPGQTTFLRSLLFSLHIDYGYLSILCNQLSTIQLNFNE